MILLSLFSCMQEAEPPTREALPPSLVLPDVTGVDFETSFRDALDLVATIDTRSMFDAHTQTVLSFEPDCPDIYIGVPPEDVADVMAGNDPDGVTWSDHCAQDDGRFFSGFGYWESDVDVQGDAATPEGRTAEGARALIADGVAGDDDGVLFEFDGEATDAMSRVDATDYQRWSYASSVQGTSTGRVPFAADSLSPDGWRADLYYAQNGGDVERIESRGNVYLFEGRIGDRFDSVALDVDVIGELGAGPDDCTLEPRGWIGLRDENAIWYDLVFLPRTDNSITEESYPNDPLQVCDGCGTLYIRGVQQGTVCPDLTGIFDTQPPDIESFVWSTRLLPYGGEP